MCVCGNLCKNCEDLTIKIKLNLLTFSTLKFIFHKGAEIKDFIELKLKKTAQIENSEWDSLVFKTFMLI